MPDAVLELLHGGVLFMATARGALSCNHNAPLKAFVQVAEEHDIKLILSQSDDGRRMSAMLLGAALEHDAHECAVTHAQRRAITTQQGVLAVARRIEDQHCLIVGPSVIEQNFNASKI